MAKVSISIRSLPSHSPTFHSLIVRRRPRMQINDNIEQSSYDSSRGDGSTFAANYDFPSSVTKDMITTKKHLCQRTTCICGMWFLWLPCTSIDTEGERQGQREREKLGPYVTRVWCTCTCCIRRAEAVEWSFLLSHSEQLARPAISPGNCFGDPDPSECSLDFLGRWGG